jgi:hypothetical protein
VPIRNGKRPIGLIDEAVPAVAAQTSSDAAAPKEGGLKPDDFVPIPMVPGGRPELVVGGTPLPTHPAATAPPGAESPGHTDRDPDDSPLEAQPDAASDDESEAGAGDPDEAGSAGLDDLFDDETLDSSGEAAPFITPKGARKQRRRAAAQKLDRIVSELSDRVADLETTWEEVKDAPPPKSAPDGDRSEKPPGS